MDLTKYSIIKAFYNISHNETDYLYRKICRYYSSTFHTPLPTVLKLPTGHVLLNYYEHLLENRTDEEFFNSLIESLRPDLVEQEEADIQEFIRNIEKRELERNQPKSLTEVPETLPETPKMPDVAFSYDDISEDEI